MWDFGDWNNLTAGSSWRPCLLPLVLSSDSKMNVQACSRCGYGVYPAEKISCIDQVSRRYLAFGNSSNVSFIFLHMDVGGGLIHKKKRHLPIFIRFWLYLCLPCCLKKVIHLFNIAVLRVAFNFLNYHFILKFHFLFYAKRFLALGKNK